MRLKSTLYRTLEKQGVRCEWAASIYQERFEKAIEP